MSAAPTGLVEAGLAKIDADLAFLMGCLREVLVELGEGHLARFVPWTEADAREPEPANYPARLGQVYATAFQLLNLIEENVSAQVRRAREKTAGPASEPGLWGASLVRLRAAGLSPREIAAGLAQVVVEPVLTAHPTEAKRPTALEQHRRLFSLLHAREDPRQTPLELADGREEIKVTLERLWRTGEILLRKPEVAAERRNLMYYFREVFPRAIPGLDRRLTLAWQDAGFDPALLGDGRSLPRLRFGTWVGGDRDGHPLVTADTTRETFAELRAGGLHVLARQLGHLASRLCLSHHVQSPPASFSTRLTRFMEEAGERGQAILHEAPEEPWKQYVRLLLLKLPAANAPSASRSPATYARASELTADLERLHASLVEVGAGRIAARDVLPVLRAVDAFGFHLATLDIRQNSRFHDKALGQLMRLAGEPGDEFPDWPEEQRLAWVERELQSSRPFVHAGASAGPEADAVLSCHRLLVEQARAHGPGGLGALIVSMTRQLSDLLVVYLLAREAGLAHSTPEGLVCALPVTPLFETAEDLERAPGIMRSFLAHPVTQRSLRAMAGEGAVPVQQIMIGYSDSNKESGILASQWALHRAQGALVTAGREAGVRVRFFHGRGGTISRGAGPTHRFLDALPSGTVNGDLRLTEQGETIAQKYANGTTADFNLELLLAGTAATTLRPAGPPLSASLEASVNRLVATSREVYEGLLREGEFMEFYSQATPIDALEQSSIGSRPSRRTGQRTLADLRAIPWVFSWNQARFYLPGWYGVGSALERLRDEDAAGFAELRSTLNGGWPFFRYVLMNVETNLASADRDIMSRYAGLVGNEAVRASFLHRIMEEFNRTCEMLAACFERQSMALRPRAAKTLALRADALRVLHHQQISLLERWRGLQRVGDDDAAKRMLPELLLSINAIASGLRTTG